MIERETPNKGFCHVITKQDVIDFIDLLPGKQQLFDGIERIVLGAGDSYDAFYVVDSRRKTGTIELGAWEKDFLLEIPLRYFTAHRSIFDRINLEVEVGTNKVKCWFDEAKAKAFLLVHIFVHELGHHRDFVLRAGLTSGEPFAEKFANRLEEAIWPLYIEKFGQP